MTRDQPVDVIVVGAGPSGSIASALLQQKGHRVLVLEKETFPRFSIGESLLPQCMEFIELAGMLEAVGKETEFQYKNGAAFRLGNKYTEFDFSKKFSVGYDSTFQVPRGTFDKLLADEAARQGVTFRYRHEVTTFREKPDGVTLDVLDEAGKPCTVTGQFVLDASGFGRVLPRLLNLEFPSAFPVRQAIFTHIEDRIDSELFDRNKILVSIHPQQRDVWFWLIPFGNGRSSIGVVGEPSFLDQFGVSDADKLRQIIGQATELDGLLQRATVVAPVRTLKGYAANVTTLFGNRFALLGNAAEFLDPVFSSGVTIAMKSAVLATEVLDRQLKGEAVDWQTDYSDRLRLGIRTFKTFVEAWYNGRFQDIIFHPQQNEQVRGMICSILAGYAWDVQNPYVAESERRVNTLAAFSSLARLDGVATRGGPAQF